MFRIQENVDGSTSIFCKNSGNLLCTVPSKANSSVHQRINVVEPQPSNTKWLHLNKQHSFSTKEEPGNLQNDQKDDTSLTRVSLSAIPISPDGDQSEDYSLDCVSRESFAKCLGLVPREILDSTLRETLLAEWPLRLMSRSKAYRSSEPAPKDIKIPDQLPLTSCLGVRMMRLQEEGSRMRAGADRIRAQLRAYESFCRHPWNAACPTACHFPKLRCREKKTYPVVTGGRVLRHTHTHTYTRGRRQREERERTRRTGLDARSRRLLRLCRARSLRVEVERLQEDEIRDWLSRRSALPQISESSSSSSEEDEDPSYRPSRRSVVRSKHNLRTAHDSTKCSVYVTNIVMDIRRHHGTHYVKDTHIRVPFFKDFLGSLRTNPPLLNAAYVTNRIEEPSLEENVCVLPSGRTRNNGSNRTLPTRGAKFTKEDSSRPIKGEVLSRKVVGRNSDSLKRKGASNKETKKHLALNVVGQSSEVEEFPLLEGAGKVCQKRTSPKTMSVVQKDSSSNKAAASRTEQKTKESLVLNLDRHSVGAVHKEVFLKQNKIKTKKVLNVNTHSPALKGLLQAPGTSSKQPIPVIDLTQETTPPKMTGPSSYKSLHGQLVSAKTLMPSDQRSGQLVSAKNIVPSGQRTGQLVLASIASNAHRPRQVLTKVIAPRSGGGQQVPSKTLAPSGHSPESGKLASSGQSSRSLFSVQKDRFLVSQWKFRCFACGFQRLFFNREQPIAVEKAVRDHMQSYHYVSEAESFLSRYLDSVNHCTVIEAFPGFKGDDD